MTRDRRLYDQTPALLQTTDAEGRMVAVSDRWLAWLGYARSEVIGRPWQDFLTANCRGRSLFAAETWALGHVDGLLLDFQHREGYPLGAELSASLVCDADGLPDLCIATLTAQTQPIPASGPTAAIPGEELASLRGQLRQAVTGRQLAEVALEHQIKTYKASFNAAPLGIAHTDLEGRLEKVNPRFCEMMGYSAAELRALTVRDITYPDDLEKHRQPYAELLAGERDRFSLEKRYRRKDGSVLFARTTIAAIRDDGGGQLFTIAIVEDIGDRKQAELKLQASQQLLQLVMDHMSQRIFWKGLDGCFLGCNEAFARDMGQLRPEDIIGKSDDEFDVYTQETLALFKAHDRLVIAADRPLLFEEEVQSRQDGTPCWRTTTKSPLRTPKGELLGIFCSYEDVTERVHSRQKLQRYRHMVEVSKDGICLLDPEYRYQIINKTYRDWYGYGGKPILGQTVAEVLGQDTFEHRLKPLLERCLQGETIRYARWFDFPHLGRRFRSVTLTPYREEPGDITGILTTIRDLTALRQSETRQQQFLEMLEATPDFIGMALPDGEIVYINPAMEAFVTVNDQCPLVQKRVEELVPPLIYEKLCQEVFPIAIAEGSWSGENILKNGLGEEIPVSQTVTAHLDESGSVQLFSTIIRDIRPQKTLEQELRERLALERLLSHLSSEFVNLSCEGLLSGIAHTLRYVADTLGANRGYLYRFADDQQSASLLCEWHLPTLTPLSHDWQVLRSQRLPGWFSQFCQRETIAFEDIAPTTLAANEDGFEREFLEALAGRSLIFMPIRQGQRLVGYFGFSLSHARVWSDHEVSVFRLIGDLLANAFQREQAEAALRHQEHYFRSLTEHASDLVMLLNLQGCLQYVTPSVSQLLGYDPAELQGQSINDLLGAEDGAVFDQVQQDATEQPGTPQPRVLLRLRRQGQRGYRYFEAIATSLLEDPVVQGVVVNCRDVSDRIAAENAQQLSDQEFRAIFEQAAISMAQISLDGDYIKVNPAFCQLVGYSEAELLGEHYAKVTHPEDLAYDTKMSNAVAQGVVPAQFIDKRFLCSDGSVRHVQVAVTAVQNAAGSPAFLASVYNDVTEQVIAERSLRSLVEGTASVTGEAFFSVLAQRLANCLGVDHVMINQLNDDDTLTTLTFWSGGNSRPTMTYFRANTPCDRTLHLGIYCCPEGVQELYPEDKDLERLNADSYLGVALVSQNNRVLGEICALHSRPMQHLENAIALLRIFAARAGAELERQQANQALKNHEANWRNILDNMPVLLKAINEEGTITLWNKECERVTGYSAEEVVGNPDALSWFYPDEEQLREIQQSWSNLGDTYRNWELPLTCKDGSQRIIAWSNVSSLFPIPDLGSWGVGVDVTERRRAEDALRESEARFQRLAANMPGIIYRFHHTADSRDYFSYVSPGAVNLWGIEPEVACADASQVWALLHPDDVEQFIDSMQRALTEDNHWFYEHRIITLSGQQKWLQGVARVELQADGSSIWDGILIDVTARKQAENDLIASEERFQRLVSNTPGIIFRYHWDADGSDRFSYVSSACQEIWEISPDAAVRDSAVVWDLFHPDDRERLQGAVEVSCRDLAPLTEDYRIITESGSLKWLRVLARPVQTADGGYFWDGVIIDVTQQTLTQERLRNSEALKRAILEALPDLLIRMSGDGMCLGMRYPENFKVVSPKEEHVGRYVQDTLPKDTAEDRMRAVERALATGQVQIYDYQISVHGELRWEEARVVPMANNEVLVLIRDIDDRKRAEAALRESEALNRAIIRALPDMMIRMTLDGDYIDLQFPKGFPALWPRGEAVGRNIRELIPADLAEDRLRQVAQAIATQQTQVKEYQIPINGQPYWEESRIFPLTDTEVIVLIRDIDERRRAEEEVRRLNSVLEDQNQHLEELVELRTAELRTFMNSLPDQIFVVDRASNTHKFGNDAVLDFFGKASREEFVGKTAYDCFAADRAAYYDAQNQQVFETGELLHLEESVATPDGTAYFDTYKIPLKRPDGDVYALIGTSRNITELVQIRQALEDQAAQLVATNQELQSFSYSVSHDLRAPLRHINGFIAALKQRLEASLEEPDAKVSHYLEVIEKSSIKMGMLIDGLLTLSRVGRREMTVRPVSLQPLVEQAIALIEDSPENAPDRVQFSVVELPIVWGDPALLQQVFSNLIDNAVKFSRDRTPAIIEVGQRADGAFFVRDNGVGFDMAYADKLFSPFQRLHRSEEFQGTGIGLAIVNRIIRRHDGEIWADSVLGHGTTIYFTLPLND